VNGQEWLILLGISGGGIAIARYWYHRPSDMSEMQIADYAYETLENICWQVTKLHGEDLETRIIRRYPDIEKYMERRCLNRRERDDVLRYMMKVNWLYKIDGTGIEEYAVSQPGMQELKTADHLRLTVEEAVEILRVEGIGDERGRVEAAAVIAAALRIDARSAPSGSTEQAKALANQIQDAARERDSNKIGQGISLINGVLQMATYAFPLVREVLRILGMA